MLKERIKVYEPHSAGHSLLAGFYEKSAAHRIHWSSRITRSYTGLIEVTTFASALPNPGFNVFLNDITLHWESNSVEKLKFANACLSRTY